MINEYKGQLTDIYTKIREQEAAALRKRREIIKNEHPEILDLDNEIGKMCIRLSINALRSKDESPQNFEELKDAITELRARKYELLVSHGYNPEYLNLHYRCSKCKDTGYIVTERCSCYKQKLVSLQYKASGLENAIKEENFDTFNLNYYPSHRIGDEKFSPRKNIETILNSITTDYLPNFSKRDDNLLFYGTSGTGKTFLSNCIAKELLDQGYLVVYRTSDELIKDLKEIRFNNNLAVEDLLINCDLLVIDDLGAEQITEFSVTELFTLLNKKLLNKKKMLISTNMSLQTLTKYYAERITSRLFGNFKLFKFYSEDIRVKKNLAR
ncbi:ATP-binding protein [Clostridium folliculivorans]|uniref:DNA replication protein DnaC n=1 Tax=Clostridium folliculivorans TaxID=2886038 RepID=A0A9W6DAY6_9CLOT|nr:ATP-binding protein [Clostridium folliculivorans]GKU25860.1 DNA replication protein DnaC [Clostridium folliculivorans]GKU27946.1 DNA replication protein DnaC [Clostridium folliculivorans]